MSGGDSGRIRMMRKTERRMRWVEWPGKRYGTRGRVLTYIGGASPIGTCTYGNGNTYRKGKLSLTKDRERRQRGAMRNFAQLRIVTGRNRYPSFPVSPYSSKDRRGNLCFVLYTCLMSKLLGVSIDCAGINCHISLWGNLSNFPTTNGGSVLRRKGNWPPLFFFPQICGALQFGCRARKALSSGPRWILNHNTMRQTCNCTPYIGGRIVQVAIVTVALFCRKGYYTQSECWNLHLTSHWFANQNPR